MCICGVVFYGPTGSAAAGKATSCPSAATAPGDVHARYEKRSLHAAALLVLAEYDAIPRCRSDGERYAYAKALKVRCADHVHNLLPSPVRLERGDGARHSRRTLHVHSAAKCRESAWRSATMQCLMSYLPAERGGGSATSHYRMYAIRVR